MTGIRNRLLGAALVAGIAAVPASVGAFIFTRPGPPPPVAIPGGALPVQAPPAPEEPRSPAPAGPISLGTLHVTGTADVTTPEGVIPVTDGRYLFLGGETVAPRPGAIAALRLAGAGTVYVCPGASATVDRDGDAISVALRQGAVRVRMPPATAFRLEVGDATLVPAAGPAGHEAEVSAEGDGEIVLWAIAGPLRLDAGGPNGSEITPGTLYRWPAGGNPAQVPGPGTPAPAAVEAGFAPAAGATGAAGAAPPFLCRASSVYEYALLAALPPPGAGPDAPGDPDAALPDAAPPVPVPPGAAEDDLAFDPDQLPPTGAGAPAPAPATFTIGPAGPATTGGTPASPS